MRVNPALVFGTILFAASPVFAKVEATTAAPARVATAKGPSAKSGVHSRAAQPRARISVEERAVANPKLHADIGSRRANADAQRYADREARAGAVADYRGGDTVVIGATTATIVLAVILLIVLL